MVRGGSRQEHMVVAALVVCTQALRRGLNGF